MVRIVQEKTLIGPLTPNSNKKQKFKISILHMKRGLFCKLINLTICLISMSSQIDYNFKLIIISKSCHSSPTCRWDYSGLGLDYQILAGPSFVGVFTVSGVLIGVLGDRVSRWVSTIHEPKIWGWEGLKDPVLSS